MKTEKEKQWLSGFYCACAITVKNHGCTTEIEDTLRCSFNSVAQMRKLGIDEFDIEILKPVIKEIERKKKLK